MSLGAIAIEIGGTTGLTPGPLLLACRTCFFLACFGMGRFYRTVLKNHDNLSNPIFFSIILALQLALLSLCNGKITYVPSWCSFPNGFALTYLATFTGIAFVLRLSKLFGEFVGNTKPVRAIADNTFSIMCHHYFGFFLTTCLFAALSVFFPLEPAFDFSAFYNTFYFYYPADQTSWALLYCAVGVGFSLLIHWIWEALKVRIMLASHKLKRSIVYSNFF